jgi:hypothetical protein
MARIQVAFNSTNDIRAEITEVNNATFSIVSVTCSIYDIAEDEFIRENVAANYSGNIVFYHETFNQTNGYAENKTYRAEFRAIVTIDGLTYQGTFAAVTFRVFSVYDNSILTLVDDSDLVMG